VELAGPEGDAVVGVEGEGRIVAQIRWQEEATVADLVAALRPPRDTGGTDT
jgi:hypothetical protein